MPLIPEDNPRSYTHRGRPYSVRWMPDEGRYIVHIEGYIIDDGPTPLRNLSMARSAAHAFINECMEEGSL